MDMICLARFEYTHACMETFKTGGSSVQLVLEKNKISHQVILYTIEVALMKKIVQSILCIGSCIYIYMLLKGGML